MVLAIAKSPGKPGPIGLRPAAGIARLAGFALLLACVTASHAQTNTPSPADYKANAQRALDAAQKELRSYPNNTTAAWQLARAAFGLAEFATNHSGRAELAEQGIAACRHALELQSNSAPVHYYLGMNLGQLARTKGLGALKIVHQIEHEFLVARDLDSSFDYAGPERNLGLLYRDAPSIGSVGSRPKARRHMKRAVELAGDYPENRLNLIESYLQWHDRNDARQEYATLQAVLPAARAAFAGSAWAESWEDWDKRLKEVKKQLEEKPKDGSKKHD